MSTTEPTPTESVLPATVTTVAAEVHQVLDTAKADVTDVVAAVEHLHFGDLATEAKQLVHDSIEVLKQRVSALLHGGVPTQAPPAN